MPIATSLDHVQEMWADLAWDERREAFEALGRIEAEELFVELSPEDQVELLSELPVAEQRLWLRLLEPDNAADVIQAADEDDREGLLGLLDAPTRNEVVALLNYAEDDAGGLMSPRFARVRPDMTIDEAIAYVRRQARGDVETIYYTYVLDAAQKLVGVVSFRQLFAAPGERRVRDIMETRLVTLDEETDQEEVARLFSEEGLLALPVIDDQGRMKGIVTIDDAVGVAEEEATEDIHKFGGTAAIDQPYLDITPWQMIRKRSGWLTILMISEMLTTSAMAHYDGALETAGVLAMFIPLIISSGGNSGSQAATLVIRGIALGEVRSRNWFRVLRRELAAGLGLGAILCLICIGRIVLWPSLLGAEYSRFAGEIAASVGLTLIGIVTWGTLAGSMLPLLLRRIGFDPASASAPFVATLVDVTGIVIYFQVAMLILRGTVL